MGAQKVAGFLLCCLMTSLHVLAGPQAPHRVMNDLAAAGESTPARKVFRKEVPFELGKEVQVYLAADTEGYGGVVNVLRAEFSGKGGDLGATLFISGTTWPASEWLIRVELLSGSAILAEGGFVLAVAGFISGGHYGLWPAYPQYVDVDLSEGVAAIERFAVTVERLPADVCRILKEVRTGARLQRILEDLESGDDDIRRAAEQELSQLDDARVVSHLYDYSEHATYVLLRMLHDEKQREWIFSLVRGIEDTLARVGEETASALRQIGYDNSNEIIIDAAGKRVRKDVSYCVRAYGVGPSVKPAGEHVNSVTGPVESMMPVHLNYAGLRARKPPLTGRDPMIVFDHANGKLEATLVVRHASRPRAKWLVSLDLLDADGNFVTGKRVIDTNWDSEERAGEDDEKVRLDFGRGFDVLDAKKFALSIESFWTSWTDSMQIGEEISLPLELSSAEYARNAEAEWVRFAESNGTVGATAHIRYRSWPKAKWRLTVEFLDVDGRALDRAATEFENSGVLAALPLGSERDFSLLFSGDLGAGDIKIYTVTLERVDETFRKRLPLCPEALPEAAPERLRDVHRHRFPQQEHL